MIKLSLIKNFIIYGLALGLSKLALIAILPFITQVISVENFGSIELIQSIYNILLVFGILQLDSSLQRYYDHKSMDRSKLFNTILFMTFLLSFSLVVIVNIALFICEFDTKVSILISVSLLLITSNITTLYLILIRYEGKVILLSVLVMLQVLIQTFFLWYFIIYNLYSYDYYFISLLIGNVFICLALMLFSKIKITMKFDKKCFFILFPYAWPQVPARIISSLSQNVVRFFIGAISFFALGIYSASFKIASISQIIYLSFNMAWGPFVFKKINDRDYHKFKEINFYILMIVSVFVILAMLLSGPVARLLLDPKYYEAIKFIPLYFTCNIIFIVKDSIDIGTKTTEKTKSISYVYVISFSIAFLAFSFLYYFGVEDLFIYGTVQFICGYLILIFTLVNSERLHFVGFSKQNYFMPLVLYFSCFFQYKFNLYL